MFSASALVSALLSLIARTFSNVIVDQIDKVRAAAAQRELGAKTQALDSTREAERQEEIARSVDKLAAAAVDDPRDLRKD